jgi:Secretion system C-terminal sorting domain
MRKVMIGFCFLFTLVYKNSNSQVTIASDDFENSFTLFSLSGTGNFYSGNSAAGDRPATSPFSFSNTYAFGVLNNQATLTSNSIDVSSYTSIELSLKIAAFSIGDINNGLEAADFIQVSVSPDGGINYYQTIQVRGFSNSYWSYAGGTAIASTAYDGNLNVVPFGPNGNGERTTDGYSTLTITNLPQVTDLRIRIFIQNNFGPELWLVDQFEVKGLAVTGPLINVFPFTLSGFSSITGNPSTEQTFSIRGLNLTNDITINPPTGFQISQSSGIGFGSSITLNQSAGTVPWTAIYTRLNSATLGPVSGNVVNSSSGATSKNVSVAGNVYASEPTISSTVSFSMITGSSMTINFTGGNGAARLVVMRLADPVVFVPDDGFNYSASSVFGNAASAFNQSRVYNGTGNSVNVTGLSSGSTYHVAVFEYNDGGVVTARNYYTNSGTGNATTTIINEGLEITATNTLFKIDFDNTVARVNNGSFNGTGIVLSPSVGQLNSNAWSFVSMTGGPASVFGGTNNSGGGVSSGDVITDNFYSFETVPGNRAFGVQSSDVFWRPGNLALRLQNNTGITVSTIAVSYKYYVFNNSNGAVYHSFEFSTNNLNYWAPITDTTIEVSDVSPMWKAYYRTVIFPTETILNGSNFYFRWVGENYNAAFSADEIAFDDISVVADPTTVFPRIDGTVEEMYVVGRTQLSGNTTVTGDVTLIGQNIELGDYNLFVDGDVYSLSSGYLQTNGTGSVTLNNVTAARLVPLGVTTYNPLIISNGSGLNWTFRLDNGVSNVITPNNTDRAVLRTWTITPSTNPPPAGANIIFQYNDGDLTQIGSSFNTAENVQVWHNDGFGWTTASGGLTPTGTPGGIRTVTLNNWSDFSAFAISDISGALPVKFGPIKALKDPAGVKIKWTNYTETNILYYTVERSADARTFTAIGSVNSALNNGNAADYSSIDPIPFNGNNYYRIAAVETNGNIIYSMIVRINLDKSTPGILVFPNPVQGAHVYLQLTDMPKGVYDIKILNINSQLISKMSLSHDGGSSGITLSVPPSLKPGLYFIQLYNKEVQLQSRLIMK